MSTRFFCFCFSAIQRKNASNALNLNFRKKKSFFYDCFFFSPHLPFFTISSTYLFGYIQHIVLKLLLLLLLLLILLLMLSMFETKRLHFRHRFPFIHLVRCEWKCFIIFLLSLLLSLTVYWLHAQAQCALVPNHTHGKPVDRKEEIRPVAILTLPSELYWW